MLNEKGKLGTLECVMILVGGMVGSAIFSLSGLTYSMAGASVIISWIIGAFILLLYGMQVAELSTIYPKSGGMFVFPYEALGKKRTSKEAWGWTAAWSLLCVNIFGAGFSAIYVSTYLSQSFPALAEYQVLIAVIWAVVVSILCLLNITVAGKVNLVMTLGLIALLLVFSIIGYTSGKFDPSNFSPFFTRGSMGGTGVISAIPVAMLAYGAIISVAFLVNQIKKPKKTIPKSMIIAMIVTIVMYAIVIVSMIGLLAVEMFNAEDTAFIQYVPLYAVAWFILQNIGWLHYVISIAATLALTTTMLVLMMTAGWTLQAAAEKGLLPKGLGKVNKKTGTPIAAMAIIGVATVAISCFPSFTSQIVNCGAIALAISAVIIAITLLVARKKNEYVEGSFRLRGGAFFPILSMILILVFIIPGVFQEWGNWAWAGIWYGVGLVLFLLFQIGAKKRKVE